MTLTLPTWDLFISLFFIVVIGFAFILRRDRIGVVIVSIYIGLAVASELGDAIYKVLSGSSYIADHVWIVSNASIFTIKTLLFVGLILLLSLKGEHAQVGEVGGQSIVGTVLTGVYGFLAAGLIISSEIYFMASEAKYILYSQSHLADLVMRYRTWWLILPLVVMIITSMWRSRAAG
jgi:hypothetical protein